MEIHTIGIDLGKTVFHLVGLDARGEVLVRKKCSRQSQWPFSSLWVIGTLVGISILFSGLSRLMLLMEMRRALATPAGL